MRLQREGNGECRAFVRSARDRDRAAHRLRKLAHGPEAHAEATAGLSGAGGGLEALEDSGLALGRNAQAAILHLHNDLARGGVF
jgi:hypothetical protein